MNKPNRPVDKENQRPSHTTYHCYHTAFFQLNDPPIHPLLTHRPTEFNSRSSGWVVGLVLHTETKFKIVLIKKD